ncbi:hypothetical protein M8J77_011013 [Diaphorina citri]|nr:hypothetical protein M8J77_011013 [Diaphorina citri]
MAPASGFVVLLCLINVHNVLAITGNTTRSPKATIHSSNDFQVKWWDQIDNSSKVPTRPQQVKTEQFNSTHPPYKQLGKILSAIFRHGNGYATTSRKPEHRDRRGCLIRTWRPNLMQFKIIDDMNENYPYTTVNPLIKGIRTSYFNVWKNEFSTEGFYLTPPVKTRPIKNPWLFMIPVSIRCKPITIYAISD